MSEWQPIESENWAPVAGYAGKYEVSDHGRVRNIFGAILKQWISDQGYCLVRFSSPRMVFRVHRLVAVAFIANPDEKPFVNHIDCIRSNNFSKNLEWCTQLENLRHSDKLGRMQKTFWQGKRSPSAMLSDAQVRRIREMYSTGKWSWESLGREFEMSKRAIGRIVNGETYANV